MRLVLAKWPNKTQPLGIKHRESVCVRERESGRKNKAKEMRTNQLEIMQLLAHNGGATSSPSMFRLK